MASHTRSVLSASSSVLPGVGHARAAERLDQRFLDDAVFDVEGQLAGSLLRGAPAHTVRQARDVFDLFGTYPFPLFGNRGRRVVGTLLHAAHLLHFMCVDHNVDLLCVNMLV